MKQQRREWPLIRLIVYLILYHFIWFASIVTAANHHYWRGPIMAVVVSAGEYAWQYFIGKAQHLLLFIVLLTVIGFIVDSGFASLNLINFNANPFNPGLCPPWMIGMWINFAIILYAHLFKYFTRYLWFTVASLLGFPLAYFIGVRMGAATLPPGNTSLVVVGITWGILFPLELYWYRRYFDKACHA